MDEDTVVDLERDIFHNGLKRIYKDSFVHMYEDKKSFELILKAALTVEEALQKLPTPKKPKEYDSPHRERFSMRKTMRWARTGLEPEVLVHINNHPQDAILDLGSDVSLIDQELIDDLA